MPSERFFNLPMDKKKRIIESALKEFARVPFDEISINRIIQDADISRGSFYQYFEDKADLQTFLLSDFAEQIKTKTKRYLQEKKGDMFQFFEDGLNFIIDIGMKTPFIYVCKNVFSQMSQCKGCNQDSPIEKDIRLLFEKVTVTMKNEYYQAYDMEDVVVVWEMLLMLVKESIVRIFIMEEPKEEVMEKYQKKVEIMKIGFKSKEKAHV
ncbi:MAG: TetR/AcrR family transcriptional regulator [Lachnospiraceae bacterium]|nr:TetR/AcrR family transcriptional regulator [Lachnospiraceae bacterium]